MTVSGIQFDKMKVYPEQDALLYQHLAANSDRVIDGYKNSLKVNSSGLNIYIETGAALIQGRLVMVDELEKLTVGANTSGFVCLTVDLTQYNTFTGKPGEADYRAVNNQVRAEILGSLVQQDLKNDGKIFTFPLASYTSTGTSITVKILDGEQNRYKLTLKNGATGTFYETVYPNYTIINGLIKLPPGLTPSTFIEIGRFLNTKPFETQFQTFHQNAGVAVSRLQFNPDGKIMAIGSAADASAEYTLDGFTISH